MLLALVSRRADAGQGAAMGLGNTFLSLGRIIGPLWAGFIFDVGLALPYLSGAGIMAVRFIVSLWHKGVADTEVGDAQSA